MKATPNRIDKQFEQLRQENRKGLFPFLVGGYPDTDSCAAMIRHLADAGVAGVELGFPFSDPIADGPVIQTAFTEALHRGAKPDAIFDMVAGLRRQVDIPLIAMVSFSMVYRIGVDKFIAKAAEAGFDGFIIPDLSLEEAPGVSQAILNRNLRLAMLVSPMTDADRQHRIASLASGFIYYMSVAGITGERDSLPEELTANVQRLKADSGKPVLVGFGIRSAEQVKQVCAVADGAIVGSAFVRRITEAVKEDQPTDQVVQRVRDYAAELLQGAA